MFLVHLIDLNSGGGDGISSGGGGSGIGGINILFDQLVSILFLARFFHKQNL